MGGGVCGAIFNAAGVDRLQNACDALAPIKTGEAVITQGFNLPAKYIIHTAGPVYRGGSQGEETLLQEKRLAVLQWNMKAGGFLRRKAKFLSAFALTLLLVSLCACTDGRMPEAFSPPPTQPMQTEHSSESPDDTQLPLQQSEDSSDSQASVTPSGEVIVTFDYVKQSGSASNQYAIWVEDMDGNYINTLYATKWTAGGGFNSRPDSIASWVEKSGIASMSDYYVDAISGATPKASGSQSYTWNLKDINGDAVLPGEYKVFVEGTLRWKNYVLYTAVVTIGDVPEAVEADAEFVYEASDRQAALTSDSPENAMIGAVTVSFVPSANNSSPKRAIIVIG
jgi:hypothetical protein